MHYDFPMIRNISDVLPAIEGRDEFVVADKGPYTVINYNVMLADTFPDVRDIIEDDGNPSSSMGIAMANWDSIKAAIRRECRGLIFCSETGNILRRPFQKFFNVNEREETQDRVIDLSRPHVILEKLDGSMICPFLVNGKMIWGTKMGATDVAKPVEEFVNLRKNGAYLHLADSMLAKGWTPIFEWCSRKQRIVLDYGAEDQLVLTAIRNMYTGEYKPHSALVEWAQLYSNPVNGFIPVVRAFEPQTDVKAFLDYVRDLEDAEGFVIRFDDGHMCKAKSHWYVQIHKAKEAILQDRNIVELILEEHLDDVKAHLPAEDRDRLSQFEHDFHTKVAAVVTKIANILNDTIGKMDRKTFALEVAPNIDPYIRPIVFKNFEGYSHEKLFEDVHNTIRNNLSRTAKYEAIRETWFKDVIYND